MTETVYNSSTECPNCETMLNPVEVIMGGSTGLCPTCRNEKFAEKVKGRMA